MFPPLPLMLLYIHEFIEEVFWGKNVEWEQLFTSGNCRPNSCFITMALGTLVFCFPKCSLVNHRFLPLILSRLLLLTSSPFLPFPIPRASGHEEAPAVWLCAMGRSFLSVLGCPTVFALEIKTFFQITGVLWWRQKLSHISGKFCTEVEMGSSNWVPAPWCKKEKKKF